MLLFQGMYIETYNVDKAAKPKHFSFLQNQDHSGVVDYFLPDTTINNFVLCSKTGLFRETHDFLDSLNGGNGPDWYFILVSNQNQICKLLFYPGSYNDEFSYFKVYKESSSSIDGLKFKQIESDQFITESGIKLGLSKEELFKIKGKNYSKELSQINEIVYSFDFDSELHDFLVQKNQAGYIAKYKFMDNKLVEFGFGYIYP